MNFHRILHVGKGLLLAAACLLPVAFSQGSREGAAQGVKLCLNVLVPSLFPMMAAAQLCVHTGLCRRLGTLLTRPTRFLFGLSGAFAPVILLSLLGGYPVGATGIAALTRQRAVSEEEARRAALFAVCAGPGFVVNFVGAAVYGNPQVGMIMYAAQVLSVLLTGVAAGLTGRKRKDDYSVEENKSRPLPFSQALVESTMAAARGMLGICAFVLLFSSLTGILAQIIADSTALDMIFVLTEVCGAVTRRAETRTIATVAFAVGFGGLCVHCQIFAALGELRVSKGLFFLFRIIQGVLTALFTHIGLRLFPQTTEVFSTISAKNAVRFGGSALSGAVLLGVMICFFISVKQTSERHG